MSFLFKSKQKGAAGATPNNATNAQSAARDNTRSPESQIPTLNGAKPRSPSPGAGQPPSKTSFTGPERRPMQPGHVSRPSEEKVAYPREEDGQKARGQDAGEYTTNPPRGPVNQASNQSLVQQPRPAPPENPYPWSQRRLNFTVSHMNPFPRYGAAVNSSSSKDGAIYLMGGLINGSTVKGDLWMVEAGPLTGATTSSCYPVATTSEGPGPRVGHASLLVGNAFIVFGGDTKMDEGDQLDDTLYLLNTSTKQWSRALPAGPRPPGRYGHTLNILGSKIYIFGGQVEGYFFNDLVAFDLNALQSTTNRWEILIQNTIDGGPPHGQIPPARTNHTMVSWGDKLFLFGGTDGVHWFNDVWSYSPQTNSWTQLECIGYIPSPREGHAAALVGDVMYIFGGRNEDGNDLGDLASFRITSRRWYTFQNMGPSPSPRSGHSMTTVGKSIVVLAGEPSSAPRDPVELGMAYYLDTSKIRYPPDSSAQGPANDRVAGTRRPTGEGGALNSPRQQSLDSPRAVPHEGRLRGDSASKLPRATGSPNQAPSPAPTGPPPQAPRQGPQPGQQPVAQQPKINGTQIVGQPTRAFSPTVEAERTRGFGTNGVASPPPTRQSPIPTADVRNATSPSQGLEEPRTYYDSPQQQSGRFKPETYQPSQDHSSELVQRGAQQQQAFDGMTDPVETPNQYVDAPEQMPKVRQLHADDSDMAPQDSGIGSSPAFAQQSYDLSKELEFARQKNVWYQSELALARKAGYQTRGTESPAFDERNAETFGDNEKPLVEAFLKMKAELSRVQETIETQSRSAASRIGQMEKQRDAAVHEAVLAKAKLAGRGSPQPVDPGHRGSPVDTPERINEINRRLASSLAAQSELSRRIGSLIQEVESEKTARKLAEDTVDAAQKRVAELESHRQQYSTELEGLRSELHEAQKTSRELSASHAEMSSQHRLLTLDKNELSEKLQNALSDTQNNTTLLTSLRAAVSASAEKAQHLERSLEEERTQREQIDQQHRSLKAQHEEKTAELDSTSRRLRDAEALASKHAEEANSHREAVLSGLGQVSAERNVVSPVVEERVVTLQQQVETANALVRENQEAANTASEKLRRAEERIAGLEAYQEQSSRDGLSVRKQLQDMMKEHQNLTTQKIELEQKLQAQMLETNALSVQHSSLKDILAERGINVNEARRSRALDSPGGLPTRFSTPDLQRMKELEQQLEASIKSHDEMKVQFDEVSERDEKMKKEYEDKLTALDNDHQAAVKYLRGTEKMLSKMKQELQRVKNENGELKKKLEKVREDSDSSARGSSAMSGPAAAEWEQEREQLKREVEDAQATHQTSLSAVEQKLESLRAELHSQSRELAQTKSAHETTRSDLTALHASHTQSRGEVDQLRKDNEVLETRAKDAENKVQLLLDQVENSVDNYRRQSRMANDGQMTTMNGVHHQRNISGASGASGIIAPTAQPMGYSHTRNVSEGNSSYSGGHDDGRNSLALDNLASELDALRSQWETTNKNYRMSDKFDFEKTPTADKPGTTAFGGSLSSWRAGLDVSDDSRPGTSDGTNHAHNTTTKTTMSTSVSGPGGATMI